MHLYIHTCISKEQSLEIYQSSNVSSIGLINSTAKRFNSRRIINHQNTFILTNNCTPFSKFIWLLLHSTPMYKNIQNSKQASQNPTKNLVLFFAPGPSICLSMIPQLDAELGINPADFTGAVRKFNVRGWFHRRRRGRDDSEAYAASASWLHAGCKGPSDPAKQNNRAAVHHSSFLFSSSCRSRLRRHRRRLGLSQRRGGSSWWYDRR